MTVMAFLLVNLGIGAGWWLALGASGSCGRAERLAYAGLLAAGQVIFLETVLGGLQLLRLPWLLAAHAAISLPLAGWGLMRRRALAGTAGTAPGRSMEDDRGRLGWETLALAGLAIFLSLWMVAAAYFLPPRGIDDLVYHLPPLYQYVRDGGISLLPVALRAEFALPMNGDFLFLWPLLFFHADTWIDLVNYAVALFGVTVLYAFARSLGISRRDSAFTAALFLFMPVVLGQAGSNYVDLTIAVCQLTLLFAAVRFWQTENPLQLLLAGVATGLGLGMKHNMLITAVAVQPLLLAVLWRRRDGWFAMRSYLAYCAAAVPFCAYWYARNLEATGHLLYPFRFSLKGLVRLGGTGQVIVPGEAEPPRALWQFLAEPGRLLEYALADPGLGSFHGGFGVVFFGLAVPALLYCAVLAVRAARAGDWLPLFLWSQVPLLCLALLLSVEPTRLPYDQRYAMAVLGLGLLALGVVLTRLRAEVPQAANAIAVFAVAASAAAVVQLAAYRWPSYQIVRPVADLVAGQRTSDYRYLRTADTWAMPALSTAWESLDFLTRDGPGWNVFMATERAVFWTAPVFGSRIQNRIWNFQGKAARVTANKPDAFIFFQRPGGKLFYLGRKITPAAVARDRSYELVTVVGGAEFWVRRALLAPPAMRARLTEFYRRAVYPDIRLMEPLAAGLTADQIIITSHPLGHALRYLELTGRSAARVRLVPRGQEVEAARGTTARRIISILIPLPGYVSRQILVLEYPGGGIPLFENTSP